MGKTRKEAEELVENVDKERMAYIRHYFNPELALAQPLPH